MKKIIYLIFPVYRYIFHLFSSAKIGLYMWTLRIKLKNLGSPCRVYFANIVEPYNVSLGHHVFINKNCDIITTGSQVYIGNYVMIGPNVTFVAQNHDFSDWTKPMILSHGYRIGKITVEDDVWIGANATILSGVTIGRGAIVAAGAVVTKNVDPYTIVGGVPAKELKKRVSPELIRQAIKIDLNEFKNHKVSWRKWGVGKIV